MRLGPRQRGEASRTYKRSYVERYIMQKITDFNFIKKERAE